MKLQIKQYLSHSFPQKNKNSMKHQTVVLIGAGEFLKNFK